MNRSNVYKLVLAVVLLGGATAMLVRFLRQGDGLAEETFYYDLSEKKLFAGPREALAPIRGLNDAEEDGVRAVVIALSDDPNDKVNRKIVYLEKYAPEFKQQLERVRAGLAEPLPRNARNSSRFVRLVEGVEWHAANSPEGEMIETAWNVPGPDGKFPVVCVP